VYSVLSDTHSDHCVLPNRRCNLRGVVLYVGGARSDAAKEAHGRALSVDEVNSQT
jgi:hypothetical protein